MNSLIGDASEHASVVDLGAAGDGLAVARESPARIGLPISKVVKKM
jgi:hypothetical protein